MDIGNIVLVMIGQIGAGKSEVCRLLASSMGARYFAVEDLRYQSNHEVEPSAIANHIASLASSSPVIFECTGASEDFEEIIENLRLCGTTCHVILLDCSIGTAIRRVRNRQPRRRPHGGGSWASQLQWTESRLRLVPADLTVSSETASPSSIASTISRAWEAAGTSERTRPQTKMPKEISFSQLATFQVCPLSYRLKYGDRVPEMVESEQMYLSRHLHETLARMYSTLGNNPSKNEVISWFESRVRETLSEKVEECIAERVYEAGKRALAFHYDVVFRIEGPRTIGVEKEVRMEIDKGVTFVGRVDRIGLDPTGVIEVIDYKASSRSSTSRPRIPDWLQIAAYSAAVLLEFNLQSVIARRIMLQTGNEERFALAAQDVRQITLSLGRWMRRLANSESFPGNVGPHCASCQFNPICPEGAQVPVARSAILR